MKAILTRVNIIPQEKDWPYYIDKHVYSNTSIDLPFGEYRLVSAHPNHGWLERDLIINSERTINLNLRMDFKPETRVRINSIPEKAEIYYNEILLGKTPLEISHWPEGPQHFQIKKPGFLSESFVVHLLPKKPNAYTARLSALKHKVQVNLPEDQYPVNLVVTGKHYRFPVNLVRPGEEIALPPDKASLEIFKDGYYSTNIHLSNSQEIKVPLVFGLRSHEQVTIDKHEAIPYSNYRLEDLLLKNDELNIIYRDSLNRIERGFPDKAPRQPSADSRAKYLLWKNGFVLASPEKKIEGELLHRFDQGFFEPVKIFRFPNSIQQGSEKMDLGVFQAIKAYPLRDKILLIDPVLQLVKVYWPEKKTIHSLNEIEKPLLQPESGGRFLNGGLYLYDPTCVCFDVYSQDLDWEFRRSFSNVSMDRDNALVINNRKSRFYLSDGKTLWSGHLK